MRLPLSFPHRPVFSRRLPARLAPGWHKARNALPAMFAEVARYVGGRQRSGLHGRTALGELEERLRRDVGVVGAAPDGRLSGREGLR